MVPSLFGLAASDSAFGDLGGTNAPQVAIGRLPAVNAAQLDAMIQKIKSYEALPASFADPGDNCFAEAYVLAPNSGAIAFVSASGFSFDYEAEDLNWAFMTSLSDGSQGRLGDHLRRAMVEYNQSPHFTPADMYNLIGDPALRLRATPTVPPEILAVACDPARGFLLTAAAAAGQKYSLLSATDVAAPISAWTVIATGTAPAGPFTLIDSAATNAPGKFYRIRSP